MTHRDKADRQVRAACVQKSWAKDHDLAAMAQEQVLTHLLLGPGSSDPSPMAFDQRQTAGPPDQVATTRTRAMPI